MRIPLVFGLPLLGLFAGCNSGGEKAMASTAAPAASSSAIPAGSRLVTITASETGFSPSTVPAKRGESLVLRFTRTTSSECLKAIAIPELNVKADLPLNQPVDVPIKADKVGKIGFQCWMAMVKGSIEVTDS